MRYDDDYDENQYNVNKRQSAKDLPIITIILIAINIIIFIYLEMNGSTENGEYMLSKGAMYVPYVMDGQYYRLFTSMFMHFGLEHLINNMFMLAILGYQIEKEFGQFKFLVSYFLCGVGGSAISGYMEMRSGDYNISAGASGAVFGIFAILLVMIFINRRGTGNFSPISLIILLGLMVFGNMGANVDWIAHLGGAITGLIMGTLLYRPKKI